MPNENYAAMLQRLREDKTRGQDHPPVYCSEPEKAAEPGVEKIVGLNPPPLFMDVPEADGGFTRIANVDQPQAMLASKHTKDEPESGETLGQAAGKMVAESTTKNAELWKSFYAQRLGQKDFERMYLNEWILERKAVDDHEYGRRLDRLNRLADEAGVGEKFRYYYNNSAHLCEYVRGAIYARRATDVIMAGLAVHMTEVTAEMQKAYTEELMKGKYSYVYTVPEWPSAEEREKWTEAIESAKKIEKTLWRMVPSTPEAEPSPVQELWANTLADIAKTFLPPTSYENKETK